MRELSDTALSVLAASPPAPAETVRARVLVVDDTPESLRLFSTVLSAGGMDAVRAESGARALEILGTEKLEAVLTDVRMPGMNGIELLLAIRELDVDLPVILVTGCPEEDLPAGAMELAPGGLLLKPVDGDLLVRTVSRAVRFCRLARVARLQPAAPPGPRPEFLGGPAAAPAFGRALSSLYLAWQPVVRSSDGSVHGHEAFARTLEPSLAAPSALFDVARDLERIVELGRVVRRTVAAEAGSFPGELFCVNVHPLELKDDELASAASPLSGLARSVVLEVSERTLGTAGDGSTERVKRLRSLGFKIAIDDFGSGEADVAALERFEPDLVKLDLPFVRGLDADPARRAHVRSLAKTLHELGIEIVAEGVETPGERHAAIDLGFDYLQGFLFGRPKPVS